MYESHAKCVRLESPDNVLARVYKGAQDCNKGVNRCIMGRCKMWFSEQFDIVLAKVHQSIDINFNLKDEFNVKHVHL